MFDKFKLSAKQVFIYSLGNIFSKLVGFILLPLYSQHISISDYSSLILIEPIWQLLSAVLSFSLPTALLRWLAPEKDFKRQGSMVFTTLMALVFILLHSIYWLSLSCMVNHQGVYDDPKFKLYLDISFLLVTFDVLNLLVLSLLRFHEKPWQYIILNTLKLSVNLGLNIYFIVRLKMGVEAILLSQLIASVLLNIFSSPFLIKHLVPKFEVGPLKEMLKYGFPLIFTSISAIILSLGDRYVVQHFLTRSDTGVYGIGYKFGGIINMFIIQSFQLGFLPIAYKMLEDAGAKRFFSRIFTYYFGILMLSAFALSVFSPRNCSHIYLGNPV
jgi:O-antigen/teichoic acid export membrane protein